MASRFEGVRTFRTLFEGDPAPINTYAVIIAGDAGPAVRRFADWLSRGAGRDVIAGYSVRGAEAFRVWPADRDGSEPSSLPR
jgi:ABC-type tungstate transport system permease subunit